MTGFVRFRAKARQFEPPKVAEVKYPLINGICPSWCDVECFVVAPDGTETPLTGVKSIEFEAHESSEPLTAKLTVYLDEIDVLAEVKS